MQLQLHLTDNCNANCEYCYINQKNTELTLDTLQKQLVIVDKINKSNSPLILTYFGGEPLLYFNNIILFDEYIKSHYEVQHSFVQTNGLLLTQDIKQTLDKHDIHIGISCDGKQDIGYKHFCELVSQKVISTRPKMIISPYNVGKMMENIDAFHQLAIQNQDNKCYIDVSFVKEDVWQNLDTLKEQLKYLEEYLFDIFIRNHYWLRIGFIERVLQNCVLGNRDFICFAGCQGFSLAPNGNIYPCSRFYTENYLPIYDVKQDKINIDNLYITTKFNNVNYSRCAGCKLLGKCNQGCFFNQLKNNGKILPSYCNLLLTLYDFVTKIQLTLEEDMNYKLINSKGEISIC